MIAIVSGSLFGFPTSSACAERLEAPGVFAEYPAYTAFKLVPVERTRYARIAREFFAGQGKRYLRDSLGNPFAHAILAGRHRITGGTEPDLVLMIVPLVRQCCDPAEVNAVILPHRDGNWLEYEWTQGFGTARGGSLLALVSPIVGVTHGEDGDYDLNAPFWVPPMRDGRRTIVWNDGGIYWNGTEWRLFCWRRCDERG